jgi:hypothetical protein
MTQTQIVQALADKCEVTKKIGKNLLDTLAQIAVAAPPLPENSYFCHGLLV